MHPKNVLTNIQEYYTQSLMCPLNVIEYKEKRKDDITKASVFWDKVYNMSPLINQLNCSYILGCNDYIITPFVAECAGLLACVEDFETKTKQKMKGCSEVTSYYNNIFGKLDKSQFVSWMLADLEYWSQTYGFNLDKKQVVEMFKQEKNNWLKKLK